MPDRKPGFKHGTLRALIASSAIVVAAPIAVQLQPAEAAPAAAEMMPTYAVDTDWPKIPNGWVTGHVPSVAVDSHDNVWIITRPSTVPADQKAHTSPPVIEFDKDGKYVQSWGGPGQGYDWPDSPHSITVDYKGNVWITGSSPASPSNTRRSDDMVLKFTSKGKFLGQIGGYNKSGGNADTTSVHLATQVFVYPKTEEAFVSDGYGNRRVIVFDADTLKFKRMWGAFGNKPVDWQPIHDGQPAGAEKMAGGEGPPPPRSGPPPRPTDITGPGPDQFGGLPTPTNAYGAMGGPTHNVQVSNDGLVYVADRAARRMQVFTLDGKYVNQVFVNRTGPSGSSVCGIAFSPDRDQKYIYIADYGNSRIVILDRKSLKILYQFGTRGAAPGQFQGIHFLAVDSKNNIYAGEVAPGARVQKFDFKGLSAKLPANALTPAQIDALPEPTK
jgi:DNA-binding beta-propeller fold protein YncE